ncbi:VOC family protein [Nocardioides aequoreus]|uniref:VOC family protein n=1 Tax=Nocardioides aequoreus TaxID=397278 RepID=UPI0004C45FDA|nr:VOC family protein [Nocardioides aequoreus]
MTVTTVLAAIPSSDLDVSRPWWSTLLGREPDLVPMPTDLEWHVPEGGGLQLIEDAERAGSGSVTLVVDDVGAEVDAARGRGLDVPHAQTVPSGQFRLSVLADPDGNRVVLAESLER